MSQEKLISVMLKAANGQVFTGIFVIKNEDLELAKKVNPPMCISSGTGPHSKHFCHFNDFEITVKSKDEQLINVLREKNLLTTGYNLLDILENSCNSPEWRDGIVNKAYARLAIMAA